MQNLLKLESEMQAKAFEIKAEIARYTFSKIKAYFGSVLMMRTARMPVNYTFLGRAKGIYTITAHTRKWQKISAGGVLPLRKIENLETIKVYIGGVALELMGEFHLERK